MCFFLTKKWYQKLYQKTNKQNKLKNSLKQGRNEVYGIRDQRLEKDRDQGSQLWDLESQCVGSGSAGFFMESGIRDQIFAGSGIEILIIFGMRDQIFG